MDTQELLKRITIEPDMCHGKPCIRGLRYPVDLTLELLSSGMSMKEILADYEDLEREDILAALAFLGSRPDSFLHADQLLPEPELQQQRERFKALSEQR